MAFNPLSGTQALVTISSTNYAFQKFAIAMKVKLGSVNNFNSVYEQYVVGLTGAKVTLEGPYDEGNMAFTCGNSYTLVLQYTSSVTTSIPCKLESIDMEADVDAPAQKAKLVFQSNGSFSAAIT